MGLSVIKNVRIAGVASCVPKRVISNINDCQPSLRSDRERLVRNIGIERRRICSEWQCFSDLAQVAAECLLDDMQWSRKDIDALIVITQSPDYLIPSTAIILQDRLGLENSIIAYDVNLGCSAYPFGLHLLGSMIASGAIKKALMLIGDKCASVRDPLFSDAGTATALEFSEAARPMYFDLNSDGSGYKAIMLPIGGHREPYAHHHGFPQRDNNGQLRWPSDLVLDGPAVLSFSTKMMPPSVIRALSHAGMTLDDIDFFVFHQANRLINETIRRKLALAEHRVPSTLKDYGNSSGASIPLTMTIQLADELRRGRRSLLLGGFGVGLSWGTCIVDIEDACLPGLIED
jgi:3-oxoacyl-[acyl-carrier-protein] synthase III